jgi:L-alanine-DL-glutamate epimerase-like enolase superfamily enzyme
VKITSVDVLLLKSAAASLTNYPIQPVICRVNTDEGITGFGEAGISTGVGEHAAFGMLQDMAPLLIGSDPMDNEVIWEQLRENCYGHISGGGVVVFSGMSAFDTALMDIKGKALGVPVYQLLGGKYNEKLHCYASQVQQGWNGDWGPRGTAKEYADICKAVMQDGFDAVKINFLSFDRDKSSIPRNRIAGPLGRDIYTLVEERLAAIRETCGEDLEIIAEFFCLTDLTSAANLDGILHKYNVLYAEEATTTFNFDLFRVLAGRMKTPLATGERVHTRWGYHQLLQQNAIAVIQPDLSNCGGISEAKKICDMAQIYDARVQLHVCGTPIAEAATLQVEAAIPNFYIHELLFLSSYRETTNYGKYRHEAVDSYITVPDLPGIGQELSEKSMQEAVAKVTIK